jgi:cell division protein FtsN
VPGENSAQRPALRAWTVQVGSFERRANAERLAQQLTAEGFEAVVSAGNVSGRTLYRVRSGAASDRASMETLAAQLRAAGHAGTVLPR